MKKLLIATILVAALAVPAFSQVTHWGGVRFDTPDNKAMITYGQLLHLGGHAYMIPQFGLTLDMSKAGFSTKFTLEPDVAILWGFGNGWTAGPILGPGFDWQQNSDGNLVSYLPFTVGGIISKKNIIVGEALGIDLSQIGVWFALKNKIDIGEEVFNEESSFYQGTALGLGLSITI